MAKSHGKWIMVEGVEGKLCPVPNAGPGSYYGMREKASTSPDSPLVGAARFVPERQVHAWHIDAQRASRVRIRGDGEGGTLEVQDLIQHGPMVKCETRAEAQKLIEAALEKAAQAAKAAETDAALEKSADAAETEAASSRRKKSKPSAEGQK